jgi:acetyl-CoA carboxylase biotin carboxylase subunit
MFARLLVGNRGEIAVRVIRACRELGVTAVAVYSDADERSLHVQMADEAHRLGPAPALESYLHMDRLVEAAKRSSCEAIHPGYGFLAENGDFAARCEAEGLVFVGPTSSALKLVGDKLAARRMAEQAGVPVIPGMHQRGDDEEIRSLAAEIGYPVLVKASAGGGGKGMRVVWKEAELTAALAAGRQEAGSAFGDDTLYVEKYLQNPRHVEFQVLADAHGNAVHLFERDCSVQRRHQKIVEESPSPALNPALRSRMGEDALKVAAAAGYTNAGTVEFLLGPEGNYYFLEVNARIQVEHPVTEFVTGIDLVKRQIRIAAGEHLGLSQGELAQRGHSIECRVYAEDPEHGFLPSAGRIAHVSHPEGPGVRCDSGIYSGCDVPVHYDPILAKVITWAEDRESARVKMLGALEEFPILGVRNTVGYLCDLISHPAFVEGKTHTGFIAEHMASWSPDHGDLWSDAALAAAVFESAGRRVVVGTGRQALPSPWTSLGRWEIAAGAS